MTYGNFVADSAARLPIGSTHFSARQQGLARHGATRRDVSSAGTFTAALSQNRT
jgi:hypothetical protein